MNRLIILGNGFDLAHGLPTKYSDFVNSYFDSIQHTKHADNLLKFEGFHHVDFSNNTWLEKIQRLEFHFGQYTEFNSLYKFDTARRIVFNNQFFYHLTKHNKNHQWVDIEEQYFSKLLYLIKQNPISPQSISKLNLEMDTIKIYFESYLEDSVIPMINSKHIPDYESIFSSSIDDVENFISEFSVKLESELRFALHASTNPRKEAFARTVVLNFNYTNTFEKLYLPTSVNTEIINIHGEVGSIQNAINLGFGDEMNEQYKVIENLNNNEYSRLMKSFAYLNTNNYKKLINFLEFENFQIQIIGHSCGLSDRTLLNTLFEHHNCVSIKPYYHQWEDNFGDAKDNYFEMIQNISRHFNKKVQMREKVVSKESCQAAPQFTDDFIK